MPARLSDKVNNVSRQAPNAIPTVDIAQIAAQVTVDDEEELLILESEEEEQAAATVPSGPAKAWTFENCSFLF